MIKTRKVADDFQTIDEYVEGPLLESVKKKVGPAFPLWKFEYEYPGIYTFYPKYGGTYTISATPFYDGREEIPFQRNIEDIDGEETVEVESIPFRKSELTMDPDRDADLYLEKLKEHIPSSQLQSSNIDIRKIAQDIVEYDKSIKKELKNSISDIPGMSAYVKDRIDFIIDNASDANDLRQTLDVIWQASEVVDEKLSEIIGD